MVNRCGYKRRGRAVSVFVAESKILYSGGEDLEDRAIQQASLQSQNLGETLDSGRSMACCFALLREGHQIALAD
ncbi:hypothetical protein EYZ11_000178 [Aspergillus tanneri]|uniref:Uncharacterized protein n=1 Tax=Aspergillus tanneri TaxID=1220188 RepID=A0A4S3JXM2_9EURO|nr:hypothetical protein EYZ11_000178 [Aspergillus tanneri]